MVVKEKIIEVLQLCYDPEIPIDLWNLGLIYRIDIHDNETVCTEAIHIKNRSQALIAKEEYLENKIVYDRLANNLGLEHKKLWKTRTEHLRKKRQLRRKKIGRTWKPSRPGGY